MARKNTSVKVKNLDKRIYPIKVRLIKPNDLNKDKLTYNGITLCTYKDTEIDSVETLMKLKPYDKYLIIKSDVEESKVEVLE